jgi:hypothetical protein
MNSLLEWGPAHLRDQTSALAGDDLRDDTGERPDDN